MRAFRTLFWALGLVASLSTAVAAEPGQDSTWAAWGEARAFYDSGKLEEALRAFQAHPSDDAPYYFNLGNVYFRLNQYGKAYAYFEKANRLQARDADIEHNLRLARKELARVIGADRVDPSSTWLESFADYIPLDEIRGIIGLVAFVLAMLWIRAFRKTGSLRLTLVQPSGVCGLVALGAAIAVYGAQRASEKHPPAACLDSHVVRSGPGDQYLELARTDPGMKLRLLGPVSGEWRQVRFSADGIGWIRTSSLLLL